VTESRTGPRPLGGVQAKRPSAPEASSHRVGACAFDRDGGPGLGLAVGVDDDAPQRLRFVLADEAEVGEDDLDQAVGGGGDVELPEFAPRRSDVDPRPLAEDDGAVAAVALQDPAIVRHAGGVELPFSRIAPQGDLRSRHRLAVGVQDEHPSGDGRLDLERREVELVDTLGDGGKPGRSPVAGRDEARVRVRVLQMDRAGREAEPEDAVGVGLGPHFADGAGARQGAGEHRHARRGAAGLSGEDPAHDFHARDQFQGRVGRLPRP
jgi:hypothetical protein